MFKPFPSIGQFREVVSQVKKTSEYLNVPLPVLTFTGTVKLHGTNSALCKNIQTGEIFYQSRNRLITVGDDNCGLASWASMNPEVEKLLTYIESRFSGKNYVHVYGEWAGSGIQKGVGISNLPKAFYIFSIVVDDEEVWFDYSEILPNLNQQGIYFIEQFGTYSISIDFNHPELSQNSLVELTMAVEDNCPVSSSLGHPGSTGEGIVYTCGQYKFKTKGEKHSSSKVKTVKEIAAVDIEIITNVKEFCSNALSSNRLDQGIQYLIEMGLDPTCSSNTGKFISWCNSDVIKENSDIIEANNFDSKMVAKYLCAIARSYYLSRL